MAQAPVLETARLQLRGHLPSDLEASAAMWGDPQVTRHIGGRPFSREDVWSKLLRYAGHWALLGFGYWAILERSTGRFVGEVGLADWKRQIEPSLNGAPESGWALARWAQGQGFATEALSTVLDWGSANLTAERTVCLIDPENTPSIRVATKCGYREFARAEYRGQPSLLFERTR
jgi:RimJ/RimL family protein N-acetyltransferase